MKTSELVALIMKSFSYKLKREEFKKDVIVLDYACSLEGNSGYIIALEAEITADHKDIEVYYIY